jgi:hypothetical protein
LAAKVQNALFNEIPAFEVKSKNAVIYVKIETDLSLEQEMIDKVKNKLKDIDGIKEVKVNVSPFETDI